MAYDKSGFLWVTGQASEVVWGMFTDRGAVLQRFDGDRFHDIPVPNFSFPVEHISQISAMENGEFYLRCVSKEGVELLVLDPLTFTFTPIIFPEKIDKRKLDFSDVFHYEDRDFVFVKNNANIVLYELKGEVVDKIAVLENSANLPVNVATDFIPLQKGFLAGFISQGTYFYNWEGEIMQKPESLFSEIGMRYAAWISGKWHFNGTQVFKLDNNPVLFRFSEKKNKIVKAYDFSSKIGSRDFWFWNDGKGRLLLAVNSGENLEMYKVTETGLELVKTLFSQNVSAKSIIYSKDVERYVWIGNRSSELNYYWFFPSNVQRYLLSKSLRSLYALDENRILASTEFSGWYVVNLEKNTVDSFKTFHRKEPFQLNYTRNIIPANDPTKVWTNYRYGIAKVDLQTHQLEYWEGLAIECLARWNDSTLVYGTMGQSLKAFDTRTKEHRSLLKTDSLWILALATTENKIFGATDKGLLVYNAETAKTEFYKVSKKPEDNYLLSILKTDENDFLLGTKSGKVFRFLPQQQKFELVYEDRLEAPVASMIFYEEKLWINTFNGIIKYDLKTGNAERCSTLNGFSSNESNRYSTLATENGLFVGTVNGLNFFRPEEIDSFQNSCTLVPLSMTFYDQEKERLQTFRNRKLLEKEKRIELPVNNRFFQLNFGMGNCYSPVGATFKYRLNDNPWVSIKQSYYVRLESLAPGDYELEIAAFDFAGNEIGKPLKFELVAHDFFIRTFWFKILVFLFILLMISLFYFNRLKKIKKEQTLRTSISSDLHDEVGGLLTGISMRAEILESNDLPENMQKDFVKSIATSSKEAVQAMRDVVWSIDARKDDWESLLFRLREYGNRLFEDINIHFNVETKGTPPKTLSQKIRQEIYLICKEGLNNSAKHSRATKVWLEFYFSHHGTKIVIADNGQGMEGKKTSGQGLKNMEMRADKIKAELNVESSEYGTKILINLR